MMKNYDKYIFRTALYIKFVNMTRRLVRLFGGVLLSHREYRRLLEQHSRFMSELVELDRSNLEPGLSCLVFSKDRALQLYALIDTYFKLIKDSVPLTIIYQASNELHEKAYCEVANSFPIFGAKIRFVREDLSFRESLLEVLNGVRTKNLLFLTDDNIFIREVSLKYASVIDPIHSILTFRHSPHLCYCYTAGVKQKPPTFSQVPTEPKLLRFNWFLKGYHWSDPWSLDGHVYSTSEVRILSRISDFRTPNSYENMLKSFNDLMIKRFGICYPESIILNLPINRVQSEVPNKSGKVTAEYLLEQWNKGLKLNTSVFENLIPKSTHEEHKISFQERETVSTK